jgi:hypothetical protein
MNDFTRRLRLWILNDEGLYSFARERAEELWEKSYGTVEERKKETLRDLEEVLEDFWGEWIDEKEDFLGPIFHEMLTRAFDEIEWNVIAEDFVEDFFADKGKGDSYNE